MAYGKVELSLTDKGKKTLFYLLAIPLAMVFIYVLRFLESYYILLPVALILMVVLYVVIWKRESKKGKARIAELYDEGILQRSKE